MSRCNEKGIPLRATNIKCRICGFISKTEGGHNSHKGNKHHKGKESSYHYTKYKKRVRAFE